MLIELEAACAAVCYRCQMSRWVPIFQDGEWWHSAEETDSGVGIPPEPCSADLLRKLAEDRIEGTEGTVATINAALDEEGL